MNKQFKSNLTFITKRLLIKGDSFFSAQLIKNTLISDVQTIMTSNVTQSLPSGWQDIDSDLKAQNWLNNQIKSSRFFIIQLKENLQNIGFLFLYEAPEISDKSNIRIGYLLSEEHWGKGLASELIQGLIKEPLIKSIKFYELSSCSILGVTCS